MWVKVNDLPLWIPYTFDIAVNPNIKWINQNTKPTLYNESYPYKVYTNEISQLKFGKYTTAIPYVDDIDVSLTGSWTLKAPLIKTVDTKIIQPKPGEPIEKQVIKAKPISVIRSNSNVNKKGN